MNMEPLFTEPSLQAELGEFERVAKAFKLDSAILLHLAKQGELTELNNDVWKKLENTDSNRFNAGDWEHVTLYAREVGRDWQSIKHAIDAGKTIDAPIILQFGDRYHLVAGNTRLMVARDAGIVPKMWLFQAPELHS